MKIAAIVSSLALAAAMSFAAPVSAAQIGDFVIPEESVAAFSERCTALQLEANTSATETDTAIEGESDDGADEEPGASTESADPMADENIDTLIGDLTLEQCQEAGLL